MVKKLPSREILGWISNFLQHPLTCLLQYFEENVHYCNNEQDQLPFCCCHNSYLTDEFLSKHMNSVDSLNQTMDTKSEKSVQVVNRAQLKHNQSQVSTLRGNINHFPIVLWEDWKGKEKRFLLGTWVIYNKGNIFVKTGEPRKIIERKERKNFTGSWTLKNSEIDNLRTHFSFQFLCYEPLAFVLDPLS